MRPLLLACLLLPLAAPARAEPAPCAPGAAPSHATITPAIARRIDDVDRLIARGRRNGWLTGGELQRLSEAQDAWVGEAEAAQAAGQLSGEDVCALRDLAQRIDLAMRPAPYGAAIRLSGGEAATAPAPAGGQAPSGAPRLR